MRRSKERDEWETERWRKNYKIACRGKKVNVLGGKPEKQEKRAIGPKRNHEQREGKKG